MKKIYSEVHQNLWNRPGARHFLLLSTSKTQEDFTRHYWKIVDWNVKNQNTNYIQKILAGYDMLGFYHALVVVCCLFLKSTFSKNSFRNTIRVSNGLDRVNIVGILAFISRINVLLSWVEHEKSFIALRPGREVIKLFSYSTRLRTKFILVINVKMPTNMINTTFGRLKARNFFIWRHFSFYEQLKLHASVELSLK